MRWIILFAFVIDIQSVNTKRFSYDQSYRAEQKTWKAASGICGRNGLEFEENVLKNIDLILDKKFWIGMAIFRVTTPWIEVLGCNAVPDGQEVKKSSSIVLCKKQCESYPFFVYSEFTKNCFCQHNESISFNISVCINNNDSKYSFVYKVYTGHVSDNSDGKCTILYCNPGGNGLQSANCNDTADKGRASRCNNGHIAGWGIPYFTSKQMCLERFQLLLSPKTYCKTNRHTLEGIRSWTNVFRAEIEAKLTKAEAGTKEPLYCLAGSFTENNGKRELNITRRFCNDPLQFVCRIGTASSTTPRKKLIAIKVPGKDSSTDFHKGNVSATTQSQNTLVTRTKQKYSRTSFAIGCICNYINGDLRTPVHGHDGDHSTCDRSGAVIGALGASSVIVVLVVLIVCKQRSTGIFTESNAHNYEDTSRVNYSTSTYEDLDSTKHTNLSATTNQTCDIDESSAPVYEEVNTN